MKFERLLLPLVLGFAGTIHAQEVSTIKAYVDTDVCSHLLIGQITPDRVECSTSTFKQGSFPVLVHLRNNTILQVNKQKMLKPLVGKLAEATGELKVKSAEMKLQSVQPIEASSIPSGDPARRLLDVRTYKAPNSGLHEKVRHELAMMPYISEFDFISFTMSGNNVLLTGWTVRQTNRYEAENRIKSLEGVETIVNNITILPLGRFDMDIRAEARMALQRLLPRYFWGSGSDIKIIVNGGTIVLLGQVASKADSDLAYLQCTGVRSAFSVINMLRIAPKADKEKKS